MDKAFEMDQIKKAVDAIMNHFGRYVVDCDKHWPVCWKCQQPMCQVLKLGEPQFFQCFEHGCNGRKEWSI